MMRLLVGVGIVMLLAGPAAASVAVGIDGRPIGGDFRVSGPHATHNENDPATVWNQTADEYLVVWADGRLGSSIYGRRVGADGSRVGGDLRIAGLDATSRNYHPKVAWNQTADEYLVVWVDERLGSSIYGRRLAGDGRPVGGAFRISGYGDQAAVVWNRADTEYLVVWAVPFSWDIYGRRVGSDGEPIGDDFRISGPHASDRWSPAVAWNQATDQYLVVWVDAYRGEDIYGRRVGADGKPIGGDFRISGPHATSKEYYPAVVCNQTDDAYLVVWSDMRNRPTRGWDIYGRRVGADGEPVGDDFRISGPQARTNEYEPAVVWNQADNCYLVIWQDGRNRPTRGWDIYGRRVGADGKPIGGDLRVSGPQARAREYGPALAWNQTDNQGLAVWIDWRNLRTRGWDIYGRRVSE